MPRNTRLTRAEILAVAGLGGVAASGWLVSSTAARHQEPPTRQVMPAGPHPSIVAQPDGTKVMLHLRGNRALNWQEDLNGYPVVRLRDGRYVYATVDPQGRLKATGRVVGKVDPAAVGIAKARPTAPPAAITPPTAVFEAKAVPLPVDPMGGTTDPESAPDAVPAPEDNPKPLPDDDPMGGTTDTESTATPSVVAPEAKAVPLPVDPMSGTTDPESAPDAVPAAESKPRPLPDDDPMGGTTDPETSGAGSPAE